MLARSFVSILIIASSFVLVRIQVTSKVGQNTILVSARARTTSVPEIGLGFTYLTAQLAEFFPVARAE